jgi:hypothetical protein
MVMLSKLEMCTLSILMYTFMCRGRVKPRGVGIPKDEVVAESSPAVCEYPPPMGFIHHEASGKCYHEPKQT